MILKVFSSLSDSTILFPFENSSVLSRISWTYQPTWKRQTPFQEGDSVFKISDSNLPYLMMHRLNLQLKGSDLQLKHRSSDHVNKDMSAFSKTEFLLLFFYWVWKHSPHFWYGKIHGTSLRWSRNLLPWHSFFQKNLTQPRDAADRWLVSLLFGDGQPMHRFKSPKSQDLPKSPRSEPGNKVNLDSQSRAPFSRVINLQAHKNDTQT